MSLTQDLKVLYHLACKPVRGETHAERLESFYSGQAGAYDDFRERLLKGRSELITACERYLSEISSSNGLWLDLGGGTGRNLAYSAKLRTAFAQAVVVDLSESLLKQADQRINGEGWRNVSTLCADVTRLNKRDVQIGVEGRAEISSTDCADKTKKVQLVTFSYSLTMIPDWYRAIDNAIDLLEPGGMLGIVDFYVGRKHGFNISEHRPAKKHSWFTRSFWSTWFALDNVFLCPDHLPYLLSRCELVEVQEHLGSVPYIPFIKVPYYIFIGRKRGGTSTSTNSQGAQS
jgi:S-adenosylmethionine-diacylgycerolhomoserine-N-methlytransferase